MICMSLAMQITLDQNWMTKLYNLVYQSVWQPKQRNNFMYFVILLFCWQILKIAWNVNKLAWENLIAHSIGV